MLLRRTVVDPCPWVCVHGASYGNRRASVRNAVPHNLAVFILRREIRAGEVEEVHKLPHICGKTGDRIIEI